MTGLLGVRWRRRTVVRVLLSHAQLLFAGIFLQGLIPGSHVGGWLIVASLLIWAGPVLFALSLDGSEEEGGNQ